MGCGSSTRAIAPEDVCTGRIAHGGFSAIVPESSPSIKKVSWEAPDESPKDAQEKNRLKDDEEQKPSEPSRRAEMAVTKVKTLIENNSDEPATGSFLAQQPNSLKDDEEHEQKQPESSNRKVQDLRLQAESLRPQSQVALEPEGWCFNDKMIPAPINLQDYNSFNHVPTKEDLADGRPIESCSLHHEMHIKKIRTNLGHIAKFPEEFKDFVFDRRNRIKRDGQKQRQR